MTQYIFGQYPDIHTNRDRSNLQYEYFLPVSQSRIEKANPELEFGTVSHKP